MKKDKRIIIFNDNNGMDDPTLLKENILYFDNKIEYSKILVVASFGLWYGRKEGKKEFNNLFDAIASCAYDSNIIYFNDKKTTLMMESHHHDGVNYYKFYKLVNNRKKAIKFNELIEGFYNE